MAQHAVIVHFKYTGTTLASLNELEDLVSMAVAQADVGEYDGHDISKRLDDVVMYFYGPDAQSLFEVVKPFFESVECVQA